MKVIQITNSLSGSIGNITKSISNCLNQQHIDNYIFISTGDSNFPNTFNYSNPFYKKFNAFLSKINGKYGFDCTLATRKLVKKIEKLNPDSIIIHNIHGHDVNLELLFKYLNSKQSIKCYWIFHDLWAFTGGCCYPDECNQWKTKCFSCPQRKSYSWFFDTSSKNFSLKKSSLLESNLHIICPSKWIADSVNQSFLNSKKITIINNGINTSLFNISKSNLKEKLNIANKKIILYVSNILADYKGLNKYIELSKEICNDYVIILIGKLTQKISLPDNIIHINKTSDINTLVKFYNIADIFLNLTTHDNFPTVNLEAQSCGTPVICTDVGGCRETLADRFSILLQDTSINSIVKEIECSRKDQMISTYLHNYAETHFNNTKNFNQLIELIKNEHKAFKD